MLKKMSKKNSDSGKEDSKVKKLSKPVVENQVEESDPAYLNEAEQDVIKSQVAKTEEESNHVSLENMEKIVALIEEQFNLKHKGFTVTSFKDSSNKCVVSVSNEDFDMTITIRDREKYGLL